MHFLDFESYANLPGSLSLVSPGSPAQSAMFSDQKLSDVLIGASENHSWTTECSLTHDVDQVHTFSPQIASQNSQEKQQLKKFFNNHQSSPAAAASTNSSSAISSTSQWFYSTLKYSNLSNQDGTQSLGPYFLQPTNHHHQYEKGKKQQQYITDRFVPSRSHSKFSTYTAHEVPEQDENSAYGMINKDVRFKNAADKDEVNQVSIASIYKSQVLGVKESKTHVPTSSSAFCTFTNNNILRYNSPQCLQTLCDSSQKRLLDLGDSDYSANSFVRRIPKAPSKVLDAPALQDDFYLNLIDWSDQNVLAVGLSSCVYLWSASNSRVTKLCDFNLTNEVTSVCWSPHSPLISIGKNSGELEIWDTVKSEKVRVMAGHSERIGTLACGSRDKTILQRDMRTKRSYETRLIGHKQEVCGLKWSFDGQQLASGGNDNKLFIWNARTARPTDKFGNHNAAVKALAWSPHQHGLLASGGGTQDRTIRFWNTLKGKQLECIETGSQVCNLIFSKQANEIVSTHGYSQNQVIVWNYPDMEKLVTLTGHSSRVLYLAMSPDGSTIVTGAGDETLRFWNVFPQTNTKDHEQIHISSYIITVINNYYQITLASHLQSPFHMNHPHPLYSILISSLLLSSALSLRAFDTTANQVVITQCAPDFDPLDESEQSNGRVLGFLSNLPSNQRPSRTTVQICHRQFEMLDITWDVFNSGIQANQTSCEDPFVESDFVAVFLSSPTDPNTYIEAQVNPLGSLFATYSTIDKQSLIQSTSTTNKNVCPNIRSVPISCQQKSIFYSAVQLENRYKANLQIPISLITNGSSYQIQHLKANFIRVDWNNASSTSSSSSWKPTTITPDCTHQTPTFGDLILV